MNWLQASKRSVIADSGQSLGVPPPLGVLESQRPRGATGRDHRGVWSRPIPLRRGNAAASAGALRSRAVCPQRVGVWPMLPRRVCSIGTCRPGSGRPDCERAERACEKERRWPTVSPPRWEEASVVKRGCAVLVRVSERWGTKQASACEQLHMRALRQA
jgi:hypothetical protein